MPVRFRELLLQVLHADPALPDPARLAALTPGDWSTFTDEAIRYRIAFQVRDCLRADSRRRALVPEACLGRLDDTVRETLKRNLRQQVYLREVLSACQRADLPVILIKGLWLVETVYRDLKARASGDIDLLFRPEDVPRFTRLARELGFDLPPDVASLCDLRPGSHEYPLVHQEQKTKFDIHWALAHPTEDEPIDEEELWRRSEGCTVARVPSRSLGLEDHLLYLCFHAVGHHRFVYVGPRALLDVARLIAGPPRPIDWDDLVARARERGWDRGAWLMLDLVREHLGVPPPQAVLDALRPAGAHDPATRTAAMEALFLDQRHTETLNRNIVRLLDEPSWLGRARLVLQRVFLPREEVALQFKTRGYAPKLPWLYLKRWGLLFVRHLPKLGRIAMRDRTRTEELERTRVLRRWLGK